MMKSNNLPAGSFKVQNYFFITSFKGANGVSELVQFPEYHDGK